MRDKKSKEPVKIKIPEPSKIDRRSPIDTATAKLVATSDKLSKITTLDLTDSPIGPEGLAAILSSPHAKKFLHLRLSNTHLGDEGCKVFAGVASVKAVDQLQLSKNQISAEGLRSLLSAELAPHLTELSLDENPLGDEGAKALAAKPLPALKRLSLAWCGLGPEGVKALAQASWIKKLHSLTLSHNPLGDEGLKALSKLPLSEVEQLSLGWCKLSDASPLASASWEALTFLDLRGNQLNEAGAVGLAAGSFKRLSHLELSYNPITPKAEKALLRAFPGVRSLALGGVAPGCVILCPYCASKVTEGEARCPSCQQDITRDAGLELPAERYRAQRRVTCHSCGAQRFEVSLLCPACKRWGTA